MVLEEVLDPDCLGGLIRCIWKIVENYLLRVEISDDILIAVHREDVAPEHELWAALIVWLGLGADRLIKTEQRDSQRAVLQGSCHLLTAWVGSTGRRPHWSLHPWSEPQSRQPGVTSRRSWFMQPCSSVSQGRGWCAQPRFGRQPALLPRWDSHRLCYQSWAQEQCTHIFWFSAPQLPTRTCMEVTCVSNSSYEGKLALSFLSPETLLQLPAASCNAPLCRKVPFSRKAPFLWSLLWEAKNHSWYFVFRLISAPVGIL